MSGVMKGLGKGGMGLVAGVGAAKGVLSGVCAAGLAIGQAKNALKRDQRRIMLISELHRNDPMLKDVDLEQLMTWYATIIHYAPKMSLDKNTVRELLQNFVRFGRIDVNTLKTLAETEKALMQAAEANNKMSWKSLLRM